jgi:RND family efflux transporter MFP subunit
MKKIVVLLTLSVMLSFIYCGQKNDRARLRKLEAEQQKLSTEIQALKNKLLKSGQTEVGEQHPYVDVKAVEEIPFHHYINVQGTVESDNNILIPAQSSGVVKKIHVTEGEKVRKDQLLAELDGAIIEKGLEEIRVNLELARTVYHRQSRLWEKGIGSEVQYLQAKTNKEALEKRLAATEEQYKLTKIISPISGSVDEILIKAGEAVAAGFGTIRVVNLSDMKITAQLSEDYIRQVKVGNPVEIELPVLDNAFESRIVAVSQVIDPRNRTFPIDVAFPTRAEGIQPNTLAVLTINDYSNLSAKSVPVNVVQKTEKSHFLFIARPSTSDASQPWTVEKKTVRIGKTWENRVEILAGLRAGEYIIVQGFQDLADGQKVQINTIK